MTPKGSQKDPKISLKAPFNPKKQVIKRKPLRNVLLKVPRSPPSAPTGPQRPARGSLRDPKPPLKEPKRSPKDTIRLSKDP